jgi:hypothetical protein
VSEELMAPTIGRDRQSRLGGTWESPGSGPAIDSPRGPAAGLLDRHSSHVAVIAASWLLEWPL